MFVHFCSMYCKLSVAMYTLVYAAVRRWVLAGMSSRRSLISQTFPLSRRQQQQQLRRCCWVTTVQPRLLAV